MKMSSLTLEQKSAGVEVVLPGWRNPCLQLTHVQMFHDDISFFRSPLGYFLLNARREGGHIDSLSLF
jgi:hypothetical protein